MRLKMAMAGLALALGLNGGLAAGMPEAQAAYKKGNEAMRLRNYAQAVEHYHEVLAQEPSYGNYLDKPLGQAYLGLQDEGKALYHLSKALERNPSDARLAAQVQALEARDVLPDSSGVQKTLSGDKVRRHHIYLNTGDIARSTMSLGYEFGVATHATGLIDVVFGNRSDNSSSYTTYGGGLGVHFWPTRLDGFFAGPKINWQTATFDYSVTQWDSINWVYYDTRRSATLSRISMGAEAGYQWLYKSGVTLALGFGYFYSQYSGGDPSYATYYSNYYYSNGNSSSTMANMLLTLGYAF